MSFVVITTRCNMTCSHCLMNCFTDGEDMTMKTFKKVLGFEDDKTRCNPGIVFGGGEPTLHPLLFDFIQLTIEKGHQPRITTNGSNVEHCFQLLELHKKGLIKTYLSQDPWHDKIDVEVVEAYREDASFYETTPEMLHNHGRCDFGVAENDTHCVCPYIYIMPNGDVSYCGCTTTPVVGNVNLIATMDFEAERQKCQGKGIGH